MRLFIVAFILFLSAPLMAQDQAELKHAQDYITQLGNDAISALEQTQNDAVSRRAEFESILNRNFDMDRIAQFSLGRYWRAASDSEKREYVLLFNQMVIDVYNRRFTDYSGQELSVTGAREAGRGDIIVTSQIVGSGQPISVDWRLRNGKVIDVIVEGVSMSVTQRNDFASIIQRNGGTVQSLIDYLKKQS
jgi:phospholipid transport system substrate-binding protein